MINSVILAFLPSFFKKMCLENLLSGCGVQMVKKSQRVLNLPWLTLQRHCSMLIMLKRSYFIN